jgi:Ni2+-binding GTPase involved in maturation of urease and hydrogenase
MTIHKVFGPPGTGKTTYLLSTVEHELDRGVLPCDIGYFAFTRKASTEARERALVKFPIWMRRRTFLTSALCIRLPTDAWV